MKIQRRVPERGILSVLHARAMELSDTNRLAVRQFQWCRQDEERLRQMALESGAMPDEFRVVLRVRRFHGLSPELT